LRLVEAYEHYELFDFSIPIGLYGDCFDRYLIRLEEMRESLHIMSQCLQLLEVENSLDNFDFIVSDNKIAPPSRALKSFYGIFNSSF